MNLGKLGDINSSIKKQQETLEKIKKETIELKKTKAGFLSQYQTAISSTGLMARQIHNFNGLVNGEGRGGERGGEGRGVGQQVG